MNLPFVNYVRTLALSALVIAIVLAVLSSAMTWQQTGNYRPFLDNTLGVVLNADNKAYDGVQALLATGNAMPETFINGAREFVVIYAGIGILLIYLLYRLAQKWNGDQQDMAHKAMSLLVAMLIYIGLGVLYGAIVIFTDPTAPSVLSRDGLWRLVPLKGLYALITNIPALLGLYGTATPVLANLTNITVHA